MITFAEADEGSVTCKIKLGTDTLPFIIELFEVMVLVLVVVMVLVRGGVEIILCLLCVSSHSKDFTVLAQKKMINCQNRTDRLYDGPVLFESVQIS